MLFQKPALLFLFAVLFCSCGSKIPPIGLDEKIRTYVDALPDTTTIFQMDVFENLLFDWDQMAIVNPYTSHDSIRNLPYRNLWPNKSTIIDFTYREEFAQLVLSKGDKVMSVDTVRRDVIDFVMLKVSGRVSGVELLTRKQVNELQYITNPITMGRFIPVLRHPK